MYLDASATKSIVLTGSSDLSAVVQKPSNARCACHARRRTLEPALLEREGEDGDDVRYFLTALTANGSGRYIAGELIADPDFEGTGANLHRPALWNLWIDDDVPTGDDIVRYRLEELLLEDWGPSALLDWKRGDDRKHDAVCYAEMSELVCRELRARAERGDDRALELLEEGCSLEQRICHLWG